MHPNFPQNSEVFVTFTGGLGAQIFSAAIYFYLKGLGNIVYADLDYFNKPSKTATEGKKGEVSFWSYELDEFNISLRNFATKQFKKSFFSRNSSEVITDGARKIELAIEALRHQEVKNLFPISASTVERCRQIANENEYLCTYIRRGDYLNVASHLVDDLDFVNLAKSISGFTTNLVVVSDSEVSSMVGDALKSLYPTWSIIVGGDLHVAHAFMRRSKFLICSNSQFSLSAALLNEKGQQIYLPTKWFGDVDSDIQIPINSLCPFQILITN